MTETKILGKFVKKPKTESITGIMKQTNTLDGKPIFKRKR